MDVGGEGVREHARYVCETARDERGGEEVAGGVRVLALDRELSTQVMSKSASKPPRGEEGADREGGTTAKKN
ncbi:MAG: hypothetical protein AAGH64_10260, partial [Planctomycetota bacterium]